MSIEATIKELIENFAILEEWEDKYKYLISLGKGMDSFEEELRTDKNKVSGCQSQVWFSAKLEDGKIRIDGDSDAVIVKGLVAILLKVYSNRTPSEILATSPEFLRKIGIDKHLSPTRKNGLSAMLKQIQLYAVAFKALAERS